MQPAPTNLMVSFRAGAPETVVTADERHAHGLDYWVDGTMGFLRHDGRTFVVAPNGPRLATHDLARGGFIDGLIEPRLGIESLIEPLDHASGGSLHLDEETGWIFLSYHGEYFAGGDPADYWSVIGLAVSCDDGASFRDLGTVITSESSIDDPSRPHPIDLGPGAMVVDGDAVDIYFQDRAIYTTRRQLSMARGSMADLRAAVRGGGAPAFHKLHRGVFESPGVGGQSDELMPRCAWRPVWFDVATLQPSGLRLLVFTSGRRVGDTYHHMHLGMCSSDGVRWSDPQLVSPGDVPGEMLYLSLDAEADEPAALQFDLYRVRSTDDTDRWRDALLERITIAYAIEPGNERDT